MEFRAEIFNIWNHTQFYSVDGNISDLGTLTTNSAGQVTGESGGTFGQAQKVRDPRLVQFALKFLF